MTGVTPLLCHNARLVNRNDPISKRMSEITSKRGKTEADLEELDKLEFVGGLYLDPSTKAPSVPATMLYAALLRGARRHKEGKLVEAGVSFPQEFYPLEYDGPKDWEALFEVMDNLGLRRFVDQRSVTISRSRIIRTRPIFREWALDVSVRFNPDVLDGALLLKYLAEAGVSQRLGDARVLGFGSFTAEEA